MQIILNELQELKKLTLLGAKKALTMSDAALLTGLSKSHIYKMVCAKQIPYYKSQGGKLTYFDNEDIEKAIRDYINSGGKVSRYTEQASVDRETDEHYIITPMKGASARFAHSEDEVIM